MTNTPQYVVQYSYFLGREVLDVNTTKPLGRISEVWVDLADQEVLGFNCRAGFWDFDPCTYPLSQVRMLNDQQIAVDSTMELSPSLMSNLLSGSSVISGDCINHGVWTQRGKWIGDVTDYNFDLRSGEIIHYLCTEKSDTGAIKRQFPVPNYSVVNAGLGWLQVDELVMPLGDIEIEEVLIPNHLSVVL